MDILSVVFFDSIHEENLQWVKLHIKNINIWLSFFFWHFVIITYMKKSLNGFKSFPTHNFTYRQAPCKLWPMHFVLQVFLNSHQYKFANKLPNFVFICFYRITCYLYWIKICLFCNVFVDWFVKKIIKILFWCP